MIKQPEKTSFKLFDFFANCEYFEHEYNYDEVIELPPTTGGGSGGTEAPPRGPALTSISAKTFSLALRWKRSASKA
jgi:hypothetical protein